MIERKYIERCSAMLCDEKAEAYLFLMLTNDNKAGVDIFASVNEMAAMLSNAAINDPKFHIAMEVAYEKVKELYSGQSNINHQS